MTVRTRFAPSPTGELHLGNVRTAVLNWLIARHHGGRFILRFEDTDVERNVRVTEAGILEGLDWLELDRDEDPVVGGPHAPYRQSERLALYAERAAWLVERGFAFRCYCRPEELEARRRTALDAGGRLRYDGRCRELSADQEASLRAEGRESAVRFRVEAGPIAFHDRVAGDVTIDGSEFGDLVILRSDGRPTYHLSAVVDDVEMEITHVVRGAGHLSNTPKQVLLYRALGAPLPEFVHIPTVLAPGGGKLSKRKGAPGVLRYREEGYHPDALVNYLSLLSWSPADGRELLTREELVRSVDLSRLGGAQPVLDPDKMRWLSGQHIRREPVDRLANRLETFVRLERWNLSRRDLLALAEVERERVHLLTEAAAEADRLFSTPDLSAPKLASLLARDHAGQALQAAREACASLEAWDREGLGRALSDASRDSGVRGRSFYQPVRVALTGSLHGPELPDVAFVLGRSRTLHRLEAARQAPGSVPEAKRG